MDGRKRRMGKAEMAKYRKGLGEVVELIRAIREFDVPQTMEVDAEMKNFDLDVSRIVNDDGTRDPFERIEFYKGEFKKLQKIKARIEEKEKQKQAMAATGQEKRKLDEEENQTHGETMKYRALD